MDIPNSGAILPSIVPIMREYNLKRPTWLSLHSGPVQLDSELSFSIKRRMQRSLQQKHTRSRFCDPFLRHPPVFSPWSSSKHTRSQNSINNLFHSCCTSGFSRCTGCPKETPDPAGEASPCLPLTPRSPRPRNPYDGSCCTVPPASCAVARPSSSERTSRGGGMPRAVSQLVSIDGCVCRL